MKRCPTCSRSYRDETQNFCLEDGAWLLDETVTGGHATAVMPKLDDGAESQTKIFRPTSAAPTVSLSNYRPNSIAVLPFAHLSADPDDEYFCDGLAEELINALAKIDDLKVVARTSAFSFKGRNVDVGQIGSILNVQHVVEGSVRKAGDRMRITVQLINAADGYHLWSDKFDTEMRDIFDVQDEITFAVVKALKTKLLAKSDKASGEMAALIDELKHHVHDIDAYQLYLRGRFFCNQFTPESFYQAVDCFTEAIDIDGKFAAAYAGLADAHLLLTEFGPVPALEGLPRAKAAALKAISLDPSLSEAHSSLALVLQEFDFDFAGAESEYLRAIELNSNDAMSQQYYGALLAQMGRHDEAEARCRKALEIDPVSPVGTWIYPFAMFLARRYDDAIYQSNRLLELDPNFSVAFLILYFANHMRSDYAASVDAYARFLELCELPDIAAKACAAFELGGWAEFLRAMTADDARPRLSSYITAVHYAALGEYEPAFASLDESLAKREGFIIMLKTDPRFDEIREHPRFQKLLHDIGFPE